MQAALKLLFAPALLAQIIAQFAAMNGMAQAAEGLRFDLAHPLAGHAHLLAHFF